MMLRYPDTLGREPEGRVPHFSGTRARAHKTLDLLQSAIGVFKIEVQISRAPYIAGKREASDVLLPRQSPWEHGGGFTLHASQCF